MFAVDYRVFAYTMLVSIAAGLILGFAPALSGRGKDPNQALAGRDTAGRGLRLRSLLVCQLAFALMLLASTGLLVKAW